MPADGAFQAAGGQRGQFYARAGIQHDEAGKIQHFFQVPGRYVQNHAHPAGNAAEIPDVTDGRGQSDMTHPLAADLGAGDFHAALVALLFLAAVFDALVFAAVALPVLGGAENAFAEQAVPFRLEGAVIDGFRFGDLAVGPLQNFFRGCHADLDGVQIVELKHALYTPLWLVTDRRSHHQNRCLHPCRPD